MAIQFFYHELKYKEEKLVLVNMKSKFHNEELISDIEDSFVKRKIVLIDCNNMQNYTFPKLLNWSAELEVRKFIDQHIRMNAASVKWFDCNQNNQKA